MAQTLREVDGIQVPAAGKYQLDRAHTMVEFVARHILTKTRGRFTEFDGWFEIGEDPLESRAEVEIRAGSIQTDDAQRDGHLRSPDFLDAERWPLLRFSSTGIRFTGGSAFELDGNLTIRDITQPVTLTAQFIGENVNPSGTPVVSFTARTTIEREDWDLTWNLVLETGSLLVGKSVDLELEVEGMLV
jgi:polyisoprenoid-binding protein YceI